MLKPSMRDQTSGGSAKGAAKAAEESHGDEVLFGVMAFMMGVAFVSLLEGVKPR